MLGKLAEKGPQLTRSKAMSSEVQGVVAIAKGELVRLLNHWT